MQKSPGKSRVQERYAPLTPGPEVSFTPGPEVYRIPRQKYLCWAEGQRLFSRFHVVSPEEKLALEAWKANGGGDFYDFIVRNQRDKTAIEACREPAPYGNAGSQWLGALGYPLPGQTAWDCGDGRTLEIRRTCVYLRDPDIENGKESHTDRFGYAPMARMQALLSRNPDMGQTVFLSARRFGFYRALEAVSDDTMAEYLAFATKLSTAYWFELCWRCEWDPSLTNALQEPFAHMSEIGRANFAAWLGEGDGCRKARRISVALMGPAAEVLDVVNLVPEASFAIWNRLYQLDDEYGIQAAGYTAAAAKASLNQLGHDANAFLGGDSHPPSPTLVEFGVPDDRDIPGRATRIISGQSLSTPILIRDGWLHGNDKVQELLSCVPDELWVVNANSRGLHLVEFQGEEGSLFRGRYLPSKIIVRASDPGNIVHEFSHALHDFGDPWLPFRAWTQDNSFDWRFSVWREACKSDCERVGHVDQLLHSTDYSMTNGWEHFAEFAEEYFRVRGTRLGPVLALFAPARTAAMTEILAGAMAALLEPSDD